MAAEVKTAIGAFNAVRGKLPASNSAAGVAAADSFKGNYVTGIQVGEGGQITITYGGDRVNENIKDQKLGLNPLPSSAKGLIWVCGKAPSPLSDEATAAQGITTIEARYLPSECRP
ncbi:MAG: pilin [Candidatus Thiosymbion ectosymbiont of Robbea hypermnestra]|nr:pilin [Candidatus Thiosymbion ectosymbiont of Robbea hypermnestra]